MFYSPCQKQVLIYDCMTLYIHPFINYPILHRVAGMLEAIQTYRAENTLDE